MRGSKYLISQRMWLLGLYELFFYLQDANKKTPGTEARGGGVAELSMKWMDGEQT